MAIGPKATEALEARKLDVEMLERLGVTASNNLGGDRNGAVMIPSIEAGQVVGEKFRTFIGEKRFVQRKGSKQIFYNFDCLLDETLDGQDLIITEGEPDCWVALQCGHPKTISVPNGAPLDRVKDDDGKKYAYVDHARGQLERVRRIILAVDGDNQGSNLRSDLAMRLGAHRCWFVQYPKGCKDLNDVLIEFGERGVHVTLSRARPMAIDDYFELSELPELVEPRSYTTGILGMDRHWKLRLGDTTVITGIPGHGKSSFVNEACCRMAQIHGWRTVFYSPEQVAQTDHRRALRSFYAERLEIDMHDHEKEAADQWINKHFGFIVPSDERDVTLDWLLPIAKSAILRKEAQILVIDPWNEMDHTRPPDMSQTEYVGFAIKTFKRFARSLNIHLIIAAHPTKLQRLKNGNYPIPTLYDISDSAHWANKPDAGVIIHREDLKVNKTLIRIAKARYHSIGVPGDLYGAWSIERTRYQIADEGELL